MGLGGWKREEQRTTETTLKALLRNVPSIPPSPPRPKYALQQVRKTIKRTGFKPNTLGGK